MLEFLYKGVDCEIDFDVGSEQFIFTLFYIDKEGYYTKLKVKTTYFVEEESKQIVDKILHYLPLDVKENREYITYLSNKLVKILTEDKRGWFDSPHKNT